MHKFEDVATSLLYQQLFLEPNIIRDRRNIINITVEDSDVIIKKMHELILSEINLWETEKEMEYIFSIAEKIPFDRGKVINNYKKKIEALLEDQLTDRSFRFLLCLSEIIKELHIKSTKILVLSIEKKLKNKMKKKEITQKLDELSQDSDINFSLLINLGILNSYAKMLDLLPATDIFNEYFDKVIQLILS
ncbi:MAG: hypothetical protein ACTSQ0_06390 [Candidatus Heimdallarchaeota archaeon]